MSARNFVTYLEWRGGCEKKLGNSTEQHFWRVLSVAVLEYLSRNLSGETLNITTDYKTSLHLNIRHANSYQRDIVNGEFGKVYNHCPLNVEHANGANRKEVSRFNYENNQQDATIQVNLLFLVRSTCFGRCFRSSSGALDFIYSIW